jgi:hypothetical protein
MVKTLLFYNPANIGDAHIGREFVRYFFALAQNKGYGRFVYCDKNSPRILLDMPKIQHCAPQAVGQLDPHKASAYLADTDTLVLNGWYAVSPIWCNGYGHGCTLNTLYELYRQHAREYFGHEITEPIEHFIPRIDFSRYAVDAARAFFHSVEGQYRKKVLISNGQPQSGQTRMERAPFEHLITDLVAAHPDVLFLLSDRIGSFEVPNVAYTRDVIGLPDKFCDLPENGYVSTLCDVVVGRASGAYSFAYLADNFLDARKTMVCFTDDERTARWIYPTDAVKARILWSNDYASEKMRVLVEEAL